MKPLLNNDFHQNSCYTQIAHVEQQSPQELYSGLCPPPRATLSNPTRCIDYLWAIMWEGEPVSNDNSPVLRRHHQQKSTFLIPSYSILLRLIPLILGVRRE